MNGRALSRCVESKLRNIWKDNGPVITVAPPSNRCSHVLLRRPFAVNPACGGHCQQWPQACGGNRPFPATFDKKLVNLIQLVTDEQLYVFRGFNGNRKHCLREAVRKTLLKPPMENGVKERRCCLRLDIQEILGHHLKVVHCSITKSIEHGQRHAFINGDHVKLVFHDIQTLVEPVRVLFAFLVNDSGSIFDDCLQEHLKGMMQ